jgi:hypothetical protein
MNIVNIVSVLDRFIDEVTVVRDELNTIGTQPTKVPEIPKECTTETDEK